MQFCYWVYTLLTKLYRKLRMYSVYHTKLACLSPTPVSNSGSIIRNSIFKYQELDAQIHTHAQLSHPDLGKTCISNVLFNI